MTWDPSPELVERAVTGWYVEPADRARILRAAVDSGELIPRERVEELVEALHLARRWVNLYAAWTGSGAALGDLRDIDRTLVLYTQEPKG